MGTKCLAFLSEARTLLMTGSCSRTRAIICSLDPHLVGDSVTSGWFGRLRSLWTLASSLLLLQLCEKLATIFLHTPMLCSMRESLMLLSVKKNKIKIIIIQSFNLTLRVKLFHKLYLKPKHTCALHDKHTPIIMKTFH